MNNKEHLKFSENRHRSATIESCHDYYDSFNFIDDVWFAIFHKKENKHIGNIRAIADKPNSIFDLGIIIGETDLKFKGAGTEAWFSFMYYLFKHLKVRRICAGTMEHNKAMLKIFKKTGMNRDGVWKDYFIFENGFSDYVHYAISNFEFEELCKLQNHLNEFYNSITLEKSDISYSLN